MARVSKYTTKQGSTILSYLATLGNKYITVDELAAELSKNGNPVGITTIYRQLNKLEQGGKVRKLVVDGISGACYQYAGSACADSLHLMCEGCGKLLDLNCLEVSGFEHHIMRYHQFRIDTAKTVLYGKCKHCAGEE